MTNLQIEEFTQRLELAVRETGYNIAVISTAGDRGYDYSRAMTLYADACATLRAWGKIHHSAERVEAFINRTYQPHSVAV